MPSPPWPTPAEAAPDRTESLIPVELRLPATPSELSRARDCVAGAATQFGLAPKASYELVYAVNEAVTNAVRHGSPAQDGTIGLHVHADGNALVCSISDCGPFVAPRGVHDPTSDEGGRGFVFMSALTDDLALEVQPDSTVVRLWKRRPGEPVTR